MLSEQLLNKAKEFFPDLNVKYKNETVFMENLGKVLFFNKDFMTKYTTTLGSDIYFPDRKFEQLHPITANVVFLHELVHVHDAKKISKQFFSFLYLFPQCLSLIFLPLMLLSWKIFLPLFILSLLPLPAFFRMYLEKRAYLVSLYSVYQLSIKKNFTVSLEDSAASYLKSFKDSGYYFMWVFKNLDKEFANAIIKIKSGQKPYEDEVFLMIDELLAVS